jgi:hypothetical protein
MIMPYGEKPTDAKPGTGPATIDFNALWDRVYRPCIEEDLGYVAIRADQDLGALIIVEMIERLAISDLVIADITTPNANVYYEVGVRHAAKDRGCVLVCAEWASPKFDLEQMRQVRFPLPEGRITDTTAAAARAVLKDSVAKAAEGITAVYHAIPRFPNAEVRHATSFQSYIAQLSRFNREVQAARLAPAAEARDKARAVWQTYRGSLVNMPALALEILYLLRDCGDWASVTELVEGLPERIRNLPVMTEQYWLAKSKQGGHTEAIAALEELIRANGDSSERSGLIGGRYKKLYSEARAPVDKARYLNKAIESYYRGMLLDLNDYYPASNLPRLLRTRGKPGDEDLAREAAAVTLLGCKRARERNPADEWVRPTLLGAAFDASDSSAALALYQEILAEGAAAFHLATTVSDLQHAVELLPPGEAKSELADLLRKLQDLVPPPAGGAA